MTIDSVSSQLRSSASEWSVIGAHVIEQSLQLINGLVEGDIAKSALNYEEYRYCYSHLKSSLKSKSLELFKDIQCNESGIDSRLAVLKALNGVVKRLLARFSSEGSMPLLTQNAVLECQAKWNQYRAAYPARGRLAKGEMESYLGHYSELKNDLKKLLFYSPNRPELTEILKDVRKMHRGVFPQVDRTDLKARSQLIALSFLFMHLDSAYKDFASSTMCLDIRNRYEYLCRLVKEQDCSIDPTSLAILKKEKFLLARYRKKMARCWSFSLHEISFQEQSRNSVFEKRAQAVRRQTRKLMSGLIRELKSSHAGVVKELRQLRDTLEQIKTMPDAVALEKFQKKMVVSILKQLEQVPSKELAVIFVRLFPEIDLRKEFESLSTKGTTLKPFSGVPQFFQYLPFLAVLQADPQITDDSLVLQSELLSAIDLDRAHIKSLQISDPEKRLCAALKRVKERISRGDLSNAIREISDICSEIEACASLMSMGALKASLIETMESLGANILKSPDIATLTLGVSYCAIPNLVISSKPLSYLKDSMLTSLADRLMSEGYYYESMHVLSEIAHPTIRYYTTRALIQKAESVRDWQLARWIAYT
ncbi:MAG: hypothetical protein K2P51_03210 [Rhabdochlamydiaceae bacterium]|nr:hypothetical protein [Rhabdochlamydiaceae bacterium]